MLLLIPLDYALPTVQAYLAGRSHTSLSPADAQTLARLLDRCARTGQTLVAFALHVAGRPSLQ